MANLKHLERLREGVNKWNQWRQQNPNELPDLEGGDIPKFQENLSEFDLSISNLRGANLESADLTQAILCFADFRKTNTNFTFPFSRANPMPANLSRANLMQANLRMAWLDNANLTRANLQGSDLWNASFRFANLQEADFTTAILTYADFWSANLQESILYNANLSKAKLSFANLSEAELSYTNLSQAIFYGANLRNANLSRTQALGTNFTRALFTGACLENWNINSTTILDDIDCQYVYLRSNNQSRIPSNRDFNPEEFTKLLQLKIVAGTIQQLLRDLEQINPGSTENEQQNFIISSIPQGMREKLRRTLEAGTIEMLRQIINNPFANIILTIIETWNDS